MTLAMSAQDRNFAAIDRVVTGLRVGGIVDARPGQLHERVRPG